MENQSQKAFIQALMNGIPYLSITCHFLLIINLSAKIRLFLE